MMKFGGLIVLIERAHWAHFGSMGALGELPGAQKEQNFKIYLLPQFLSDFDGRWLVGKVWSAPTNLSDGILNFYPGPEICSGKVSGKIKMTKSP